MAYSVRNGRLGFECDVCGVFIGDIRLLKSCYYCHKVICPLHARWALKPASLRPQFRFSRWEDRFCDVCPDCDEERQREELEKEEEERQEELEEEEAKRVIPRCQICGAHEVHGEGKTFPSPPLIFTNCERCGKLVCNFCSTEPPDCHRDWFLICMECFNYFIEEDEREREEYWREKEEKEREELRREEEFGKTPVGRSLPLQIDLTSSIRPLIHKRSRDNLVSEDKVCDIR